MEKKKREVDLRLLAKSYKDIYYMTDMKEERRLLKKRDKLSEDERKRLNDLRKALRQEYNRLLLHFKISWDLYPAEIKKDIIYRYLVKKTGGLLREAGPALTDYVQPVLDVSVWNKEENKLYDFHKEKILHVLYNALEKFGYKQYDEWVRGSHILGSLCSYQYNKDSDLDCHFIVDLDAFMEYEKIEKNNRDIAATKLSDVIKYLNREVKAHLDNTNHVIEYYFEMYHVEKDKKVWLTKGVPSPDHGEFNLDKNEWTKTPPPMDYTFDVEVLFPGMIFAIDKVLQEFDGKIGEIRRDIIALRRLQETIIRYKTDERKEIQENADYFENKVSVKLDEIVRDANDIIGYAKEYKRLKDEEKAMGTKFGFGELIFKYLQKFGYYFITAKITDIMEEENGRIPLEKINEIEEIILKPRERR